MVHILYLKLHAGELVHDVSHGLLDHVPGDLVVGLGRRLHTVSGQVVEGDDVAQHAHRFVERAVSDEKINKI